jgi:hypothetical protein
MVFYDYYYGGCVACRICDYQSCDVGYGDVCSGVCCANSGVKCDGCGGDEYGDGYSDDSLGGSGYSDALSRRS